ncbi:MAG: hypothetical protein JSV35_06185 [Candidatus Bathyarchaeota archaeon]|nr:MAG: hypothetical protein JSV35_06185 [Candidatus Bathyarchaeota archaeon]
MVEDEPSSDGIFDLLQETDRKRRKSQRAELLETMKVKEFFDEGEIAINARTCQGLECELCIKVCPTNALYWHDGKVGIIHNLCVYCGACVVACIVDDCIEVKRVRKDGRVERFSKPVEVVKLFCTINSEQRRKRLESIFPSSETYLTRFPFQEKKTERKSEE